MSIFTTLKQGLSIFLILLAVFFGNAFVSNSPAWAKSAEAAAYDGGKGGGAVDAYRQLQRATYANRDDGLSDIKGQTGRGEQVGSAERSATKLQKRVDSRRDLTSQANSVEDAAENVVSNTQNAFQRAAGKIQRNLNLNQ